MFPSLFKTTISSNLTVSSIHTLFPASISYSLPQFIDFFFKALKKFWKAELLSIIYNYYLIIYYL